MKTNISTTKVPKSTKINFKIFTLNDLKDQYDILEAIKAAADFDEVLKEKFTNTYSMDNKTISSLAALTPYGINKEYMVGDINKIIFYIFSKRPPKTFSAKSLATGDIIYLEVPDLEHKKYYLIDPNGEFNDL